MECDYLSNLLTVGVWRDDTYSRMLNWNWTVSVRCVRRSLNSTLPPPHLMLVNSVVGDINIHEGKEAIINTSKYLLSIK